MYHFLCAVTATTRLDEKSLNKIKTCLWGARFKWRHIGDSLKIDPSTLEVIRCDNRRVDDCFVAVLLKWLRSDEPVPCWKVLAEALSSPPVGVIVTSEGKGYYFISLIMYIMCVSIVISQKMKPKVRMPVQHSC